MARTKQTPRKSGVMNNAKMLRFKCPCGAAYAHKQSLRRHTNRRHASGLQPMEAMSLSPGQGWDSVTAAVVMEATSASQATPLLNPLLLAQAAGALISEPTGDLFFGSAPAPSPAPVAASSPTPVAAPSPAPMLASDSLHLMLALPPGSVLTSIRRPDVDYEQWRQRLAMYTTLVANGRDFDDRYGCNCSSFGVSARTITASSYFCLMSHYFHFVTVFD